MIPAIPRRYRAAVLGGGSSWRPVMVALPGLALHDGRAVHRRTHGSSAQSRVGGFDKAPEFIGASPVFGRRLGHFPAAVLHLRQ